MKRCAVVLVYACIAWASLPGAATGAGERFVPKADADRIFALTRDQWNAQSRLMAVPPEWALQVAPMEEGNVVLAFDQRTGVGVMTQPFFTDANSPPTMLVIHNLYPTGSLPRFDETFRTEVEAGARADLGPDYSVRVVIQKRAPPNGAMDAVDIIITKRGKP